MLNKSLNSQHHKNENMQEEKKLTINRFGDLKSIHLLHNTLIHAQFK